MRGGMYSPLLYGGVPFKAFFLKNSNVFPLLRKNLDCRAQYTLNGIIFIY